MDRGWGAAAKAASDAYLRHLLSKQSAYQQALGLAQLENLYSQMDQRNLQSQALQQEMATQQMKQAADAGLLEDIGEVPSVGDLMVNKEIETSAPGIYQTGAGYRQGWADAISNNPGASQETVEALGANYGLSEILRASEDNFVNPVDRALAAWGKYGSFDQTGAAWDAKEDRLRAMNELDNETRVYNNERDNEAMLQAQQMRLDARGDKKITVADRDGNLFTVLDRDWSRTVDGDPTPEGLVEVNVRSQGASPGQAVGASNRAVSKVEADAIQNVNALRSVRRLKGMIEESKDNWKTRPGLWAQFFSSLPFAFVRQFGYDFGLPDEDYKNLTERQLLSRAVAIGVGATVTKLNQGNRMSNYDAELAQKIVSIEGWTASPEKSLAILNMLETMLKENVTKEELITVVNSTADLFEAEGFNVRDAVAVDEVEEEGEDFDALEPRL